MTTLSVKDQLYYRELSMRSALSSFGEGGAVDFELAIKRAGSCYDYLVQLVAPPPAAPRPADDGASVTVVVPAEMLDRVKVKKTDTVTLQDLRRLKGHEMDILAEELRQRGFVPA